MKYFVLHWDFLSSSFPNFLSLSLPSPSPSPSPLGARRIELIQDFEFPVQTQRLKVTGDGETYVGVGTYKPRVRVWDVNELSLKFERHIDCEAVQLVCLEEDWRKMVLLHANRYLEFHSAAGSHYKLRVPRICWDMTYEPRSCDLFVVGTSTDVYRLNLEQGRFLSPLESASPSTNVCCLNSPFSLLATGSSTGFVECWDTRSKHKASSLPINPALSSLLSSSSSSSSSSRVKQEVSSLSFSDDGLHLLVGSSGGVVLQYDIRSKHPETIKDHQYGTPIKYARFLSSDLVLSADTKVLKAFDRTSGRTVANLETSADINDVCVYPHSGLITVACEQPRVEVLSPSPSLTPSLILSFSLSSLSTSH